MDTCPVCGAGLPYTAVLRACLFRRATTLACPSCGHGLENRTPLAGIQVLWFCAGALVLFRGLRGEPLDAAVAAAVALGFWTATFFVATPWLCRFESAREGGRREPSKPRPR